MRKAFGRISIFILAGSLLLTGCAANDPAIGSEEPPKGVAVGEPNPAAGTSPTLDDEAGKAMQREKSIEGIVSITLKDLDGKDVDRTFSAEEISEIEKAFNESYIMDTAYIEMIAGNTMTIALEDGREVFITSYGEENFIVARIGEGATYHLGCPVIGKILLEEVK